VKYRFGLFATGSGLCVAVLGAAVVLSSLEAGVPAHAAVAPPGKLNWNGDPSAPDMSGVWVRAEGQGVKPGAKAASKEGWGPWPAPLKGAFAVTWKKRVADEAAGRRTDDPVVRCMPAGMPRFMTGSNGPLLIIQSHQRVLMYRDGEGPRRIWLDGRPFPAPADLETFIKGTAIGRYEGSDLVIESVGFKDEPIDATGVPHSGQLKITERLHRVDAQTLKVDVSLIDALAYSKPMTTTVIYKTLNDPLWEPREFICTPKTNYHPERYVR
jgi:hypothetical protein